MSLIDGAKDSAIASGPILLATEALRVRVLMSRRSQGELADKVGISRTLFNGIINGMISRDPDDPLVTKICTVAGLPRDKAFRLVK